ncbi:MAG: OadG family protein [Oscillospiraceae bacterium]|jgi:sodium pump decarboxylase gamma subunit|nr:OadG family protein [Oscillospiraceae bacterium]
MDWSFVLSTVVTGLVVVFLILLLLIGSLALTGKLLADSKNKKKPALMPVKISFKNNLPVKSAPVIEKPRTDEKQVIAVITAAIQAYGEEAGKKLKITDIKKREPRDLQRAPCRSVWGNAGVSESMR